MSAGRLPRVPAAALAVALGAAVPARAQPASAAEAAARELAERVARVGDGVVRLWYAVRGGVCGDGAGGVTIRRADGSSRYGEAVRSSDDGWGPPCEPGPARVTLAVRGGVPREVWLAVGGPPAPGRARDGGDAPAGQVLDLGTVSAPAAAAFLLDLAARSDAPPARRLLLGAVVAESSVVWPRLLGLARDARLSAATRREATFWAGSLACDALADAHPRPAPADTAGRDVRRDVVFALSQRPGDERAATLTRVARADRDPAVRCAALFWLGQGAGGVDARVLDLYEEALRRP